MNLCLEYLTERYHEGLGYSSIITAKSAIIALHPSLQGTPLLSRFMKGIFNLRPSLPRYTCTWDVEIVLNHLQTINLEDIDLKVLSRKLATLLLLLSGQRLQTLHVIKLSNIKITATDCVIYIDSLLKTSCPTAHTNVLRFEFYESVNLCVIRHLQKYIELSSLRRGSCDQLFISYTKPYHAISKDTISRWVKTFLQASGVDIPTFTTHSNRSASTSKGLATGIPIEKIMQAASWSNAKTFARFYNKPISSATTFGKNLLDNVHTN